MATDGGNCGERSMANRTSLILEEGADMDLQTLRFTLEERKRSLRRIERQQAHLRGLNAELVTEIEEIQGQIIAREGHVHGLHYLRQFPNDRGA